MIQKKLLTQKGCGHPGPQLSADRTFSGSVVISAWISSNSPEGFFLSVCVLRPVVVSDVDATCQPAANGFGERPGLFAILRSPPCPKRIDSSPANNRRCRSSSRLNNATVAMSRSRFDSPSGSAGKTSEPMICHTRNCCLCRIGTAIHMNSIHAGPAQATGTA